MKNLFQVVVLVGLVALMANIPAVAQNTNTNSSFEAKFTSTVPFYAGEKLMEPGDYTFRQGGGVQADR